MSSETKMSSIDKLKKHLTDSNIRYEETPSSFKISYLNGMTFRYNGGADRKESWAKEILERFDIK